MQMQGIPFCVTDWREVAPTTHHGEQGFALWRTQFFGRDDNKIRVRFVEYSAGYQSDHWCEKGHVLYCLDGELETTLKDGRVFMLKPGMSYQVADGAEAHRSRTKLGAKLFIVD